MIQLSDCMFYQQVVYYWVCQHLKVRGHITWHVYTSKGINEGQYYLVSV